MIQLRGAGVVLVAILLLVLAEATRVGWILLFDAVLWGTLVVSAIMPWLAIGRLTVRRSVADKGGAEEDPGPMEGDAVQCAVTVRNPGLLPSMFVTIHHNCGGEPVGPRQARQFIAWLGKGQEAAASTLVRFDRRGLRQLPPPTAETRVPFGLFRRSKRVGTPAQLLVLPKVYPVTRLAILDTVGAMPPRPLTARIGEQTAGSRNYVAGDPWQQIHWRNTARTSQPQVKLFERSADKSLTIALSTRSLEDESADALEHAVRIAASVGVFVCRSEGAVSLLAGEKLEAFVGSRHLLESLAILESGGEAGLVSLLRHLPGQANVLAIVPETDIEGIEALERLASGWVEAAVVIVRGFGTAGRPTWPLHRPHDLAVPAVDSWPDGIPGTLDRLGQAERSRGDPIGLPRSPR